MTQTDLTPISAVGGEGFKELTLAWYLEQEYIKPSRATMNKHIEKHLNTQEKKDELKVKLTRKEKLALSITCWTGLTNITAPQSLSVHHQGLTTPEYTKQMH